MTRDDIIKWAHEAQLPFYFPTGELAYSNELMCFAELVAAAEQKPKWNKLTKDEVSAWKLPDRPTVFEFCQFIESKLKAKSVTAKRKWVGLTDEEIREVYTNVRGKEWCLGGLDNAEVFYDTIETKLKEKNNGTTN